jgi:hypothetical protein
MQAARLSTGPLGLGEDLPMPVALRISFEFTGELRPYSFVRSVWTGYGNRLSQGIGIYNVMYVPLMIHSVMELLLSPHPVQVVEMTIKSTHDSRGDIESLMSATHLEFGNSSGQSWKRSLGPR